MHPQPNHQYYPQNNITPSNSHAPKPNTYTFNHPQFANQPFLSPKAQFADNRNVYASTIQVSTSSNALSRPSGMGLGKLESMGRVVKEQPDPIVHRTQEAPLSFLAPTNNERLKMASSVIVQKNYDEDVNRFPGFNVANNQQTGTSKLDALFAKKQSNETPKEQLTTESAEERRKREINSIKQQLDFLNKRMENTVGKKVQGETKPYFQLPSRKSAIQNNPILPSNAASTNKPAFQLSSSSETSATSDSSNKAFFQNYSKVSNEALVNIKPTTVQQVNEPKSPYFTLNNPAKTDNGGMFKKKNPYALDQPAKELAPKTLMLSPKAATQPQVFKAEPTQTKAQIKAAETVQPVFGAKKGIKRTGSSQNSGEGPRVFKKSDFAIGKKMGKGQFGQVMLVQHKQTGFLCGMKVMSKKQIREEKYVNQIARELSIQFYLNHRNVAPLYGYFQDQENVYLLIEYCTGGQLLQMLRKNHRMEEAQTSPIIREICQGLDFIHKEEIIHRDIKPQNILFNFNTVKICDFGWAVHCGSGMRKTVSGSPLYYSPEVVQETEYDEKVDIWAIGMMTYECILGKIPFRIYSELDLNRIVEDEVKFPEYVDVSDDAKDFILGIMQKNPDDRMVMKDIFKHPFIRKYLNQRKLAPQIVEQLRRVLS